MLIDNVGGVLMFMFDTFAQQIQSVTWLQIPV